MLPGHRYCSRTAAASGVTPRTRLRNSPIVTIDVPLGQHGHVAAPLAQRRQLNGHHLQPIEEVLAEPARLAPRPRGSGWSPRSRGRRPGCRDRPPTRLNVFSSRKRRSFACSPGVISPISSRNTVPPSAVSNRPRFCCRASVNAPRSWPKSSLSSSCSGSAEHVMFTNGLAARSLCSESPWRPGPCRFRSRPSAARSTRDSRPPDEQRLTAFIAGELPMIASKPNSRLGCAIARAPRAADGSSRAPSRPSPPRRRG